VNFQNIPRTDKEIKRAIRPKLDCLAFFDYSQIEYRLLAFYLATTAPGDDSMAVRLRSGQDAHEATARLMLGYKDEVPLSDDERQVGKTGNFSIVYGGGIPTIQNQLGCDFKEAKRLLRLLKKTLPGVAYLDQIIQQTIDERRYIKTLWGRHLHLDTNIPEDKARRKLLNALVQGCAADLKRHALRISARGAKEYGLRSHMVNEVHDEIMWDVDESELPLIAEFVPKWMDYPLVSQIVPVEVDMEVSYSTWADKEPYQM
jgi:DNA polymerase-1